MTIKQIFNDCIDEVVETSDKPVTYRVCKEIVLKFYNARCNEYLRAIRDDKTRKENKTTNIHVGLRGKLKTYAAEKQIPSTSK